MRLTVDPSTDLRASLSPPLQFLIAAARSAACSIEQVAMTRFGLGRSCRGGRASWAERPATHRCEPFRRACSGSGTGRALWPMRARLPGSEGSRKPSTSPVCCAGQVYASVCLKGPTLARWLYGAAGFRRFADLDIMVAPRDVTAVYQALAAAWVRVAGSHDRRRPHGRFTGDSVHGR